MSIFERIRPVEVYIPIIKTNGFFRYKPLAQDKAYNRAKEFVNDLPDYPEKIPTYFETIGLPTNKAFLLGLGVRGKVHELCLKVAIYDGKPRFSIVTGEPDFVVDGW